MNTIEERSNRTLLLGGWPVVKAQHLFSIDVVPSTLSSHSGVMSGVWWCFMLEGTFERPGVFRVGGQNHYIMFVRRLQWTHICQYFNDVSSRHASPKSKHTTFVWEHGMTGVTQQMFLCFNGSRLWCLTIDCVQYMLREGCTSYVGVNRKHILE